VALTAATSSLLDDQVTTRFVTIVPFASRTVAVSVVVVPSTRLFVAGATVTLATGTGVTVSVAVPDFPSLVAVIVAPPGATAVTTPPGDTVATVVLLDAQATARPVTTTPFTSVTTAVSVVVCPTIMSAVVGCTATAPTGTSVTFTAELPIFPSDVALIVAEPGATAVTTPVVETVATRLLLDVQLTGRSVTAVPLASVTVADSAAVCPTCRLAVAGCTVTLATGTGVTVMAALALLPSLVALIVVEPGATAVTTPVELTVAEAGLLEDQVTRRFVTIVPFASLTVAVSVVVVPATRLVAVGATITLPTGTGVTVRDALADLDSLVAVMDAVPGATAVTTPLAETVTTDRLLDVHVTGRSVTTAPFASRTVARSVVVWPATRLVDVGSTATLPTGTSVTTTLAAPLFPPALAPMVADPGATAVRTPVGDTVATSALLVAHVIGRSVTTVPLASVTVADNTAVWPTKRFAVVG
jgi:hypothetical protein